MKRIAFAFLAGIVLAGMLVTVSRAQDQPLGDYARSVRKDEKPASAKKYDNDNLPATDNISVVGNATDATGPEDANPAPDAKSEKPEDGAAASKPESKDAVKKDAGADAEKPGDEWKKKIADQQGKIDLLSRELD